LALGVDLLPNRDGSGGGTDWLMPQKKDLCKSWASDKIYWNYRIKPRKVTIWRASLYSADSISLGFYYFRDTLLAPQASANLVHLVTSF
jgi:hypothetical protein